MTLIAEILAWLITLYIVCGVVSAPILAFNRLGRVDDAAIGASKGFRIIVIPGLILFWPLMVTRVIRKRKPSTEKTAHKLLWRDET